MPTTDDRNDPGLSQIDSRGMQKTYLVLSEAERKKGFVRPLRTAYQHTVCGAITTMGRGIAETYARQPKFYAGTYCATCQIHAAVGEAGEFVWVEDGLITGLKVGT